jgi:hypothetical protein
MKTRSESNIAAAPPAGDSPPPVFRAVDTAI